jgi:hypothetical protein
MRRLTTCAWIAGACLLLPAAPCVHAQDHGVAVTTRLVKLFLEQETHLQQAEREGDDRALGALLADDFEERTAARPGEPVPRADWLVRVQRERRPGGAIEQMAAHDHGSVVVVSFLVRPAQGRPRFVVDTWAREGDSWKLKVRYSAPAGDAAPPSLKPTGKG